MDPINPLIELKRRLPPETWPWVLVALRQDSTVWKSLDDSELAERALREIPAQPERWSPAALSLIALGENISLDDLRSSPLNALSQPARGRAIRAYETWIKDGSEPVTLAQAALLALSLRERLRLKGSWEGIASELGQKSEAARPVVACLYGMIPEPLELLRALLRGPGENFQPGLALHALLADPQPAEAQLDLLGRLLDEMPAAGHIAVLRELSPQRPWLATALAQRILKNAPMKMQLVGADAPADQRLSQIGDAMVQAELYQVAAQSEESIDLLMKCASAVRQLQGQLFSQLGLATLTARSVNGGSSVPDAELDNWKQAVQLAPQEPRYVAGLALALLEADRSDEARALLTSSVSKGLPSHPALALAGAQIAERLGDSKTAQQAALTALQELETGDVLDAQGYHRLVGLLMKMQRPQEAARAAELAIRRYPLDEGLLEASAQAEFALGQHPASLTNAYLAMAVKQAVQGFPEPAKPGNGKPAASADWKNGRPEMPRLLIESLEAVGAWKEALEERERWMEQASSPTAADWRLLADCALRAGQPERALPACRRALQIEPNDDQAHRLLGEASLALSDYTTAAEHFHQALRLMPQQAELWLTLAHTYQLSKQETRAMEALRAASLEVPDDARIHLALGEAYLAQNALTQALPSLQKASELAPEDRQISLTLGRTLYQVGRFDDARKALFPAYRDGCGSPFEIIRGDDDEEEYDVDVAYAYAKVLLALGEYREAADILADVVQRVPDDPAPALDFARVLLKIGGSTGTVDSAIFYLKRVILLCLQIQKEHPEQAVYARQLQAEALALLAEAYTLLGELQKAEETYKEAMEMDYPTNTVERSKLALGYGRVAQQLGHTKEAVTALQEAVKTEPKNSTLHRALAEASLAGGLEGQALQAARTALTLQPFDLENLVWFIEVGTRLPVENGEAASMRAEVGRALGQAVQLAPWRGDLLARLGKLLFDQGDVPSAMNVFRKLAVADDGEHPVEAGDLYDVAKLVRQQDEPELAVSLLRKAIEKMADGSPVGNAAHADLSANLYDELGKAYQQGGHLQAAVEAWDQALALKPEQLALHLAKADVLDELGQPKATLTCLQKALSLDPANASLRYRTARLQQASGDLPSALTHIEQAASLAGGLSDKAMAHSALLLAAELSYRMLRPQKAWAFLKQDLTESGVPCEHYEHACLRAELALGSGQPSLATEDVALIARLAPDQVISLADQSRLAWLKNERQVSLDLLKSAIRCWSSSPAEAGSVEQAALQALGVGGKLHQDRADLRSLTRAALALGQFEDALLLAKRLVELAPQEPLSHLILAEVLVVRAEAQNLRHELEVQRHVMGAGALGEETYQAFNQALAAAEQLSDALQNQGSADILLRVGDDAQQTITLWRARGQAAFQGEPRSAQALGKVVRTNSATVEDLASLARALRKTWERPSAGKTSPVDWISALDGIEAARHPLVAAQLVLALTVVDPARALQMAKTVIESFDAFPPKGGLEAPMAQYLLARLALAAQAFDEARVAIEKALEAWPDEARWHTLAARIYQSQDSSAGLPDPAKALAHLQQAARLEPGYAPHHLVLGQAYLRSGDMKNARLALEQASALVPEQPEVWLGLAQAQQAAGDLEQAAVSAEKAIEILPDSIPAQLLRGEIALQADNPRGALSRAQTILRTQTEQPQALYLLARALDALNKPADALAALEKAIQLTGASGLSQGDPLSMQLGRVQLLRRAQGLEAAIPALEELVKGTASQPALQALLAEWYFEAGKNESAIQSAQLALQQAESDSAAGLEPDRLAKLHFRIGVYMRRAGQLDQAIHHLSQAVSLASEQVEYYLELGRAHQDRREHKQALKVFQSAMQVAPNDYRPYYQAGLSLKDNKDYLSAENMLRKAAQLAPNEVSIHRLLGAVVALNLVHNRRVKQPES